ncbi:intraflagellar transport protein 88 homolog isoform X1 [Asterias rubens]|uniref:intraflagellar transport protein 88 homolog isoform X1 n=1 Tax=Asterias rubens TaxID=7604 RepID=UPI0014553EA1|nr:intraflagellar transport protein 88 homolog isoform X1 [Asterias rubens]
MEQVHLAGDEDDELYSGYNDYNPLFDTENLQQDEGFQNAVKTSHGRRPPMTATRQFGIQRGQMGTAAGARLKTGLVSSMGRPVTGMAAADGSVARPMTAVKAAGYSSTGRGQSFDPMNQASKGPAPPLESRSEDTPEEKIKSLEKQVNGLIEASCLAHSRGELSLALEKAKEAGRKERVLVRQREQVSNGDQVNLDLTYSVLFNLANQYEANEMFQEALNAYQVIVKNKMFSHAGRLRVNVGNIYFKQRNFPKAVKYYRMALDQVPTTHKEMRNKIMKNIGIVFVKMGQYSDAITSFEHIMSEKPDYETAFNLELCYYATGDRDKMKKTFQQLLSVDLNLDEEDKYLPHPDDKHANLVLEVIKKDPLRVREKEMKEGMERFVMAAAKLIAPSIEQSFSAGYDWCVDCVKQSAYTDLANDLEINKAIMYLKQKEFAQAVEVLKAFEKKDSKCASVAATNLSFIYFLQAEYQLAEKYAEVAMAADRYNTAALVNKGNCLFVQNDLEKSREFYQEALRTEATCTEALYNLGLVNKKLGHLEASLDCFLKLHAILRNNAEVLFQIATIYDMLEDTPQATEWFTQLISIVPTDPAILSRLGELFDNEGDKSQAYQYHYESFRYFPSNIEIIEWLGAYFIDSQFVEKAIHYFERAAVIQPNQVKWQLMIASCHRRSGNYQHALETYKRIHKKFPDNIECLKFLVRLCSDLGLKDAQEFATKLKKAEKAKELREQRANSGTRRSGSGRAGSGRGGSGGNARGIRNGSAESERTDSPNVAVGGEFLEVDGGDSGHGSRQSSARSGSARRSGRARASLPDTNGPYEAEEQSVDASYVDPLGPTTERPKTAARRRDQVEDEFGDEELGDDLLPE